MKSISKLMPASTMKLVMSGVGILALVVFSGFILFEATKAEVVIIDNDQEQTIQTHKSTVKEVLDEAGITVGQHDVLSHDLNDPIESNMEINYDTAREVIVTLNGEEDTYYTTADTVEAFFEEQGLSFTEQDAVSHQSTDAIQDGLHIEITEAFEVVINDGGKEKDTLVTGGSVQELLEQEDISFDPDSEDKINFSTNSVLTAGMNIEIVRIDKNREEVTETVGFETEEREDSSLLKGEKKVVSPGEEGKIKKIYEIIFENGEEVDKKLVDEKVVKESQNKVVAIGTKEPEPEPNVVTVSNNNSSSGSNNSSGSSSSSNSGASQSTAASGSSSKEFTMSSTAYTANCGGCSGYTATGINLKANPNKKVVAVDPNVIPLGSRVWVEGYGEAIAGDTGGSIVGNKIDVHVPSQSAASSWGRRTVKVKVLD